MPSGPDFFSVGELLFIAMVLAVIATVLGSGIAALMHDKSRPSPAPRALKWLGVGIAVYMAIVLAFSVKPPAVAAPRKGDPQCLAHRCVTVTGLTRMTRGEETEYVLTLRLTNSGRFPFSDQIKGVYLVDSGGRRYGPSPDPGVAPLNDELGPNSEVLAERSFTVPASARVAGLLVDRGRDGPPIDCFVIGGNCWYSHEKPPVPIE